MPSNTPDNDLTGDARIADRGDGTGIIIGDFFRDPDDGTITAGPGSATVYGEKGPVHLDPGDKFLGVASGEKWRDPTQNLAQDLVQNPPEE
jgi:hypothetical protein